MFYCMRQWKQAWHITCGPTFSQSWGVKPHHNVNLLKKHIIPCQRWGMIKMDSTYEYLVIPLKFQKKLNMLELILSCIAPISNLNFYSQVLIGMWNRITQCIHIPTPPLQKKGHGGGWLTFKKNLEWCDQRYHIFDHHNNVLYYLYLKFWKF